VFTLHLFLNKKDLYKLVVDTWKPVPPGRELFDQCFGKFEVLVSCLMLGIEKLADIIVNTYRCAPRLLSKEDLLLMMRTRVIMAQEVLSMKVTDFSADPSTLAAPDGLLMVPDVLGLLNRGEIDLIEAMKNDKWEETMETIAAMCNPDGSFLAACRSFKENAEECKKDWNDAVIVYVKNREDSRRRYYQEKLEDAQKRCDQLNDLFESKQKEWQQKNDDYMRQTKDFQQKMQAVKPLLTILLVRAYTETEVQNLMKDYKIFCTQESVMALFKNIGRNDPIYKMKNVPRKLRVVSRG